VVAVADKQIRRVVEKAAPAVAAQLMVLLKAFQEHGLKVAVVAVVGITAAEAVEEAAPA
jgi:hypothetical protein